MRLTVSGAMKFSAQCSPYLNCRHLIMNSIPQKQNQPKQIDRIAAQRQLYTEAKRIWAIYFVLSVPCVVALAFMTLFFPALKSWAWSWNFILVVVDLILISSQQEDLKTCAARIQELFDCEVLDLPHRKLKGASKVTPEEVNRSADKYRKLNSDLSDLSNWYSVCVEQLPIPLARLVCQRTNCWWDSDVRQKYANWVLYFVLFWSAVIIGIGLFRNATTSDLIVSTVAPLFPLCLWGYRQYRDQKKTATKLEQLRQHAEQFWRDALTDAKAGTLEQNAEKHCNNSRELQDEIYEHRRSNQPMADKIHKILRPEMESQMNRTAEQYVAEALEQLRSKAAN